MAESVTSGIVGKGAEVVAFLPGKKIAATIYVHNKRAELFDGTIDLLVIPGLQESTAKMLHKKILMLIEIEQKLGAQNIDLLLYHPDDKRTIVKTARKTGIEIC